MYIFFRDPISVANYIDHENIFIAPADGTIIYTKSLLQDPD